MYSEGQSFKMNNERGDNLISQSVTGLLTHCVTVPCQKIDTQFFLFKFYKIKSKKY